MTTISQPSAPEKASLRIGLRVKPITDSRVTELENWTGFDRTTVIVMAINALYKEMAKERFGYSGIDKATGQIKKKAKKEDRADTLKRMEAMSCEELEAYLRDDLDYLLKDFPLEDDNPNRIMHEAIIEKDGVKWLEVQYVDIEPSGKRNIYSRSPRFNYKEMLNDMEKINKFPDQQ